MGWLGWHCVPTEVRGGTRRRGCFWHLHTEATPATQLDPIQQHLNGFEKCHCLECRRTKMREWHAGRICQWSGRWANKEEGMRLTVCWSRAWRITWWGEKWIFYHYSSPLWQHEKAKKEVESGRLGTHNVPLVVLWVCSDESVLHLTQRKEAG